MSDLIVAIGLVLVIEGLLYAAFPNAMRQMVEEMTKLTNSNLRSIGLISAILGIAIVWIVRG